MITADTEVIVTGVLTAALTSEAKVLDSNEDFIDSTNTSVLLAETLSSVATTSKLMVHA